ncbi:PQQ-binding-like beta-propeller repeat protein [Cellulomonas sp. P22]|uniref:outer membrane protein assembly factor BamB family protein n=1 Tax=Cellulomonas sp. P22 TaxID=3373189 RepID=UPI0037A67487
MGVRRRAPRRAAGRLDRVELVEVDARGGSGADHPDAPPRGADLTATDNPWPAARVDEPSALPHRVRRWGPVAAVAVVVLLAASLVVDARSRERAARLAEVPGVLAPLDGAPTELWRAEDLPEPAISVLGGTGWFATDDVLVAVGLRDDGEAVAAALDRTDGSAVWTASLAEATERVAYRPVDCVLPRDPAGVTVLTCLVADVSVTETSVGSDGATTTEAQYRYRLVRVDLRTGEVLETREVGDAAALVELDGDLVLATHEPGSDIQVTRLDPAGEERWTATVAVEQSAPVSVYLLPSAGILQVSTGQGAPITLDPTTGKEMSPLQSLDNLFAWPVAVDDGSTGVRVVVDLNSVSLQVQDPVQGTTLWTQPISSTSLDLQILLVRDRLVLREGTSDGTGSQQVTSYDARTGVEQFSLPEPPATYGSSGSDAGAIVTDGSVLVRQELPEGLRTFVAYDFDDGTPRWSTPMPSGTSDFAVAGGLLLARAGSSVVALG